MDNIDRTRVIFLDFDGVLNNEAFLIEKFSDPSRFVPADLEMLCPKNIAILNEIVAKTGAVVVVSSTWRMGRTLMHLREILAKNGFEGLVVGKTPVLHGELSPGVRAVRGHEIQRWLDECGDFGRPDRFVIVDDDTDMAHLDHRLVRTDGTLGLQPEHVERIVALLTKD